jgi:signal transduction histidine kinase
MAGIVAGALIVGGISLYLAQQIHRMNTAIDAESEHIQLIDQFQTSFQQVLSALYSMQSRGNFDRLAEVETQTTELIRLLRSFRALHAQDANFFQDLREAPALTVVERFTQDLRELVGRVSAMPAVRRQLSPIDLERLGLISTQLPRSAAQIKQAHGTHVGHMLDASQRMVRTIGFLYLSFLVAGIGLIALSSRTAWREISLPLRRLADAATAISEGRSSKPVPVEAAHEIGRLSQAFNTMADQLHARDREIRAAREQLERKVLELTSLFRLGTQISALHDLDQVLDFVADTACELLGTDAAAILLLNLEHTTLTVRALSGPPNAFQPSVRLRKPIPLVEALDAETQHRQVLWPEFLQGYLSATLSRGGSVLGVICAASRSSREFSGPERDVLNALATLASIAVENARLSEKTRSLGILEERDRLAREIHDGLAQVLALLHLRLQRVQDQVAGAETLSKEVRELVAITGHAYDEVRQSIYGLRTVGAGGLGLIPTLSDYLKQFTAQTGLPVELDVPNEYAIRLSADAEVQVVRIIQEGLANVRKHAEATQAWVRLSVHEAYLQVAIEDDGRGFDPARLEGAGRRHIGLQSMRERAASVCGGLQVDSAPGKGTRITAWLPIEG